jgi:hypothetical protein
LLSGPGTLCPTGSPCAAISDTLPRDPVLQWYSACPSCFLLTFWLRGVFRSHCVISVSLSISSGMKRPLSPPPSGEKEPPTTAASECPPHSPESSKPKRERKRPSYTLCDVCNIQLNSAAQAQVHCGGRAHQRRLRQLSLGKTSTGPGQCGVALSLGPLL